MSFDKELMKGSTVPIVLQILSEGESYGYQIIKTVNERTGGRFEWKEGTLYPCLHRLESDGLITSAWREGPSGKKRKYYSLTRTGRRELETRKQEWREFSTQVNALLFGATA